MRLVSPRYGIFGGSFNPVHHGHVILLTELAEAARLDRVFVVPAACSPHKSAAPSAPGELRAAFLRAAFAGRPDVEVVDWELRRGGKSFTIDTLREAASLFPSASWTLLLGADSLPDFPRWKDAAEIVRRAELAVLARPGTDPAALDRLRTALPEARALLVTGTAMGVSSTLVRRRAAAGLSLAGYVPEAVAKAVVASGIYRTE
jgi:nicotinate-nucleotide adenylyltransferase